jgi:hypothetical protein
MSNPRIVNQIRNSFIAVVRTPLWLTIVAAEGVLALIATVLTTFNENTTVEGLDAGRMSLSFVTMLVLAFALFTIPAIVARVRSTTGASGFLDSFVTAFIVGSSLLVAATPALLWAMLSTSVSPAVWIPALGSLKLEVLIVDLLVAVAFTTIRRPGAATAVAYGAIVSLVVGPFLVLATVSALPGVKQTTRTWTMQWPSDQNDIDPDTGYPTDPKCPSPNVTTVMIPRYDLVWPAAVVNPFVLVSESVEPKIATYDVVLWTGDSAPITPEVNKATAPIDLFSTLAVSSRALQITPGETILINECELLATTGQPYSYYPDSTASQKVIDDTQSGFTVGLIGQLSVVALWIAGMVVIPRLRPRK